MAPTTLSKPWHCDSQTFLQIGDALQGQENQSYHIVAASPNETQRITQWYQHHPVPGLTLKKVEVIHNPQMARLFEGRIALLEKRHKSPAFKPNWANESATAAEKKQREEALALLEKKAAPYKDLSYPHVTIVPLWHGTKKEILHSLFETGFANLATTDDGFFGKGIYSAGEAEYAYRVYSQGALLINWVAVYSVFPVLRDDMDQLRGKGNYQNYDGHFAPVVPKDPQNPHEVNYYPCKVGEKHLYTELVVFESAQVLPRYLVELQPELPASPPGMGAASVTTFTAGELLDILFQLLDDPQIQKHTDLCQHLQAKADVLLELPESTPLEAEEAKLFRLAKRLLTQGKVNNAVLNSILKNISAPLSSPSALIQHPFSKQPPQLQGYNTLASGLIPPQAGLPSPSSFVMQGSTQWVQPSQTPIPSASTMQSLQQQGPIGPGGFSLSNFTSQHNAQKAELPPASTVAADELTAGSINPDLNVTPVSVVSPPPPSSFVPPSWSPSIMQSNTQWAQPSSAPAMATGGLPVGSPAVYNWAAQPVMETITNTGYSVGFISLQNGMLATASNNTIKLWERDGTCLRTLQGHRLQIERLIELKDGTLLSADMTNTIKLWNLDGTCLQTIQPTSSSWESIININNIIELKDGVLAITIGGNIELWERDGSFIRFIEGHLGKIRASIGLEDGSLATASEDKTIKIWGVDGNCIQTLQGHTDYICNLIELRDGTLASASGDKTIKLWGIDGNCIQTLQGHTDSVFSLIQLQDGTLASASDDRTIKLWRQNGTCLQTLQGHKVSVSLIELRDGTLVSTSGDDTIKLWNRNGTCLQTIQVASRPWSLRNLTQLQDGTLAASIGNTIQLWKFPLKQ